MKTAGTSWLLFLALFPLMPLGNPTSCRLQCQPGFRLKNCQCESCGHEEYLNMNLRNPKCKQCTPKCSAADNKVEVSPCTKTSRRECRCMPGFFCSSVEDMDCRRACEPCTNGFLNTINLQPACTPYTDCASKGMVVIAEGSSTQDRVCGYPTTALTPSEPTTTSNPAASREPTPLNPTTLNPEPAALPNPPNPSQLNAEYNAQTALKSTNFTSKSTTILSATISASTTSHPPSTKQPKPISSSQYQTTRRLTRASVENLPKPEPEGSHPPSWVLAPLLVFLLLVVLALIMWCKGKTRKERLYLPGLSFWKDLQHWQMPQSVSVSENTCQNTELKLPLQSDSTTCSGVQNSGPGLCPGAGQQVSMENNSKGESINNTVGSIFIYSPGMVILGSNSKEKNEGSEPIGEQVPLMAVPQQESSSQDVCLQEELSFPVPATSK